MKEPLPLTPELSAIVLAAGKGTRMKSDLAKVLHPCLGRPLIHWVLDQAEAVGAAHQVVVVGHQREAVMAELAGRPVVFAVQAEQRGTGHAVQICRQAMAGRGGETLVLSGDVPLLRGATLRALLAAHRGGHCAATVLTALFADPSGYGRVIRRPDGKLARIVEHRDAGPAELAVGEINSGIYVFDSARLFACIDRLRPDNAQGELYLTDVVRLLVEDGLEVAALPTDDPAEIQGINTVEQLEAVEAELRRRQARLADEKTLS
jgi:bifunctional UDP-N-acetylglucosamine pyrophosphorylase/glucosamine-1-phosphate N-acetyltransferase